MSPLLDSLVTLDFENPPESHAEMTSCQAAVKDRRGIAASLLQAIGKVESEN